jgi:hypothetical protein
MVGHKLHLIVDVKHEVAWPGEHNRPRRGDVAESVGEDLDADVLEARLTDLAGASEVPLERESARGNHVLLVGSWCSRRVGERVFEHRLAVEFDGDLPVR